MRVTCCSCRLKVSLLKQNKHTRNHCWLNPQLPQSHHYPNAPRGGTQRTHATQEGVLLEAAFSFFFGRGKIKFHQRAELQLIFPNPKTVDIHNERAVKQNATHKQKVVSAVLSTDWRNLHIKEHIYIYTSLYIYIHIKQRSRRNLANKHSVAKLLSADEKRWIKNTGHPLQSKTISAHFLLLRWWGIHAARFRG